MSERQQGRWAGRDPMKDLVRHRIWDALEAADVAVGPAWSMIPNFVGADIAAWRLSQTPEWQEAETIKTNPDQAQMPIRLRAFYEGKRVFAPVPYLTREFPYLRIDPRKMKDKGISFELAATAQGFVEHGDRIGFEDVPRLDFCVVGSVAVTRVGARTGKGAGFADLETAIFRELGKIGDKTPMATTVHSLQLVDSDVVVMRAHDSPLDYVATELELIRTGNTAPRPGGVAWDRVQPDQFETIPFLSELRERMLARRTPG
jgi:5-formyltetrahydrofolate cyclo-ligase